MAMLWLAAGKGRHAYIPIKMASDVQDITCVFVEVAGSYEKRYSYSVLGWCAVCNISGGHQPISVHLSGMATQINTWAVIVS